MEAVSRLFPFFMPRRNEATPPSISLNGLPRDIILIVVKMEVYVPKCEEMDEEALESMRLVRISFFAHVQSTPESRICFTIPR